MSVEQKRGFAEYEKASFSFNDFIDEMIASKTDHENDNPYCVLLSEDILCERIIRDDERGYKLRKQTQIWRGSNGDESEMRSSRSIEFLLYDEENRASAPVARVLGVNAASEERIDLFDPYAFYKNFQSVGGEGEGDILFREINNPNGDVQRLCEYIAEIAREEEEATSTDMLLSAAD